MHNAVLLDTSFFLRFLNDNDPLFQNADGYYKYLIEQKFDLIISTISIAEYCVKGNLNELPLRDLQILPFNIDHAKRTGELAFSVFENKSRLNLAERNIIPNDTKLFAQADIEESIKYYVSSDSESLKIYNFLKSKININFEFLDLRTKHTQIFGIFDFGIQKEK
jgi:hypothetical protein